MFTPVRKVPKRYINIYTEATPNPKTLKFVVNYMLLPDGVHFEFKDAASSEKSPLAQSLFEYAWVESVFVMSNFITITRKEEFEWSEVKEEAKLFIKDYLEDEKPVIDMKNSENIEMEINPNDSEVVKKIKGLLDEYVRPAVESDGGAISFHSFNEGVVKVELRGSCSGCPSSTLTLKAGIENLLKRMLPNDVTEVIAEGV
jgi:NFU1 iron-sulfur cluster scaffold homolog, mitochondrial